MESWAEKVKREHPWWWRWITFSDWCRRAMNWVLDKPYWHHENGDLVLRRLRSKRPERDDDDRR